MKNYSEFCLETFKLKYHKIFVSIRLIRFFCNRYLIFSKNSYKNQHSHTYQTFTNLIPSQQRKKQQIRGKDSLLTHFSKQHPHQKKYESLDHNHRCK